MNVLMILMDSLNRDYLSCYGNDWIKTPNIQRLADRGIVFDNHFIGSAPCIPARCDLFSGRKDFLWRGWSQYEPFDAHLATLSKEMGTHTVMVTDHNHYWDRSHGYGYMQPFDDYVMIRGQEGDRPLAALVDEKNLPKWVKLMSKCWPKELCVRYYRNVMDFKAEEDFHCARVMSSGAQALEYASEGGNFYLHIEAFDPHEPWFVPEPYRSMYGSYLGDEVTCWPPYPWVDNAETFFEKSNNRSSNVLENCAPRSGWLVKSSLRDMAAISF